MVCVAGVVRWLVLAHSYHRSVWGPQTPHTDPIACTKRSPSGRSPDRPQEYLGGGLLIHTSRRGGPRGLTRRLWQTAPRPNSRLAKRLRAFTPSVRSFPRGVGRFFLAGCSGLPAPLTQTPHTLAQGTCRLLAPSSAVGRPTGRRASRRRRAAASPAAAPRRSLSQAQQCGSSARAEGTRGVGGWGDLAA